MGWFGMPMICRSLIAVRQPRAQTHENEIIDQNFRRTVWSQHPSMVAG
jgi:hypothetical protein